MVAGASLAQVDKGGALAVATLAPAWTAIRQLAKHAEDAKRYTPLLAGLRLLAAHGDAFRAHLLTEATELAEVLIGLRRALLLKSS
eukprot:9454711-Pyramimonas_sp.AAC.1